MNTFKGWIVQNPLLIVLLGAFAVLAGIYSVVTPLFEMSDELWHYPMVKTLADGNGLPVQDPENPGPWRQEGSQPPLYYYTGAAVTFWIDTSDMDEVRRLNPHVDNGIVTEDGNVNLIVHNRGREKWPWRGTTLAVHIVRLMSVLMSTGAIYFTYRIGQEIFPEKRWLALAGAAAVAFTPMFAFVSGAINNDNLATLLAAVGLWLMLHILREADEGHPTMRHAVALGVVLGLSALTKASVLAQFALAGLTMAYAAWRRKRWQTFFFEGPVIVLIAVAIGGWWYYRNWRLYGDVLGLNAFIAILGQRARPASLAQLWGERHGFMQSYWGLFGGVNVPMPGWIYSVLNTLVVVSAAGVVITLVGKARREGFGLRAWAPMLLSLLWIVGVIVPLAVSWARITWSSQGRLVFSAISVIGLWFMAGLGAWMPDRLGQWMTGSVLVFMVALTVVAPFAWIVPAYRLPEPVAELPGEAAHDFVPPGSERPVMRLLGYRVNTVEVQPGEPVRLTLYWESLAPMERNWSVFVHLEDSAGFVAGQRDTYPGVGLIATDDLEPGYRWADAYVVPTSASAYAPERLEIKVGLYDYATCPACERMTLAEGGNAVTVGWVDLLARADADNLPNPVWFNFGDEMELIGYRLDTREARPQETVTLTLYWRGLREMDRNYTISVQVLGPEMRRYGQEDSWPLDGDLPTAAWTQGETVEDTYRLTLAQDTPPGEYKIQVAVYWMNEAGEIERLQLVTEDGRLVDDFVLLTDLRVSE